MFLLRKKKSFVRNEDERVKSNQTKGRKMKKKLGVLALGAGLLTACGFGDSPTATVERMYEAAEEDDYETLDGLDALDSLDEDQLVDRLEESGGLGNLSFEEYGEEDLEHVEDGAYDELIEFIEYFSDISIEEMHFVVELVDEETDDRSEEDIDVWYVVELDDEDEDGYHVLGVDSMDPEELEELREGE